MAFPEALPTTYQPNTYTDDFVAYEKERRILLAKAARLTGTLHGAQASSTGPSVEAVKNVQEVQTDINDSIQRMVALALRLTTFETPEKT